MPFVKKQDARSHAYQPVSDARRIFIGRKNELQFFTQHILLPEDPEYNIISIHGDGGVGKSTLLARLIDEICTPEYKDYCLSALVDERQATPAGILEKFAEQLRIQGGFKKALARYREIFQRQQEEQYTMQNEVVQRAPDFAGAVVEGIPLAGPLLREGVKATTAYFLNGYGHQQPSKELKHLEDPIAELTRAFVMELNRQADAIVTHNVNSTRRHRRTILCFDTFEQLAPIVAPWLLDHFLTLDISSNVVLLIVGRSSLNHSLPDDPKRWLQFMETGGENVYTISLRSFTEDETLQYLEQRGITDPQYCQKIWQLSHGLPLYLGLLTTDTRHDVDPTADVVANFLRWIPENEAVKRRLVLDASLFSRPFNLDDLEAFSYLSAHERPMLYRWLIKQPFVRRVGQEGRNSYHDLAEDLFSRHLYQDSPNTCYATRQVIANYYKQELKNLRENFGKEVYASPEWLQLTLALAQQLFLLPDKSSHEAAIEQILWVYQYTDHDEEVIRVLHDISQNQIYNQSNSDARRSAEIVLHYIEYLETDSTSQVTNALLEKIRSIHSFSPTLLSGIYEDRGVMYSKQKDLTLAIADFDQALKYDPDNASAYGNRGVTYRALKEYELAIQDCTHALAINPDLDWVYACRGDIYRHLKKYPEALHDFSRAIALDPDDAPSYVGRGRVYRGMDDYERSIADIQHAISLDNKPAWFYQQLADTYRSFDHSKRAIELYTRAIELGIAQDAGYYWTYASRGKAYADLGQYELALADFEHAIAINPAYSWAYFHLGKICYLLKEYERSLTYFSQAIELYASTKQRAESRSSYVQAYIYRAKVYEALGDIEQAQADYACSREIEAAIS
jgi:tetratricopeptide (TPR) repeat protein